MKFLITNSIHEYDTNDTSDDGFSILGEFHDLAEAQAYLNNCVNPLIDEQLSQHPGWHLMGMEGQYFPGNKNNKVVDQRGFKIGDGGYCNSIYNNIQLIELPDDAVVDENLFQAEYGGYPVRAYFERLRKK